MKILKLVIGQSFTGGFVTIGQPNQYSLYSMRITVTTGAENGRIISLLMKSLGGSNVVSAIGYFDPTISRNVIEITCTLLSYSKNALFSMSSKQAYSISVVSESGYDETVHTNFVTGTVE